VISAARSGVALTFRPDYTHFPEIEQAGQDAYEQAGVTDPRSQIAMAEVHDCFTSAELLIYEDLGFAERGRRCSTARSTSRVTCR
jgi:acetyl-CoA C-acetyltransferase